MADAGGRRATWGRLGLLGALYFSQGMPFGFFTQAVPVILRKQGRSLGEVGLTSLLALPWALKFLWAPLVDRHGSARLGRRRSWILPLQALAVAVLLVVAAVGVERSLPLLMGAVVVLNLLAATQDIATDGLAVDLLPPDERGLANGLQVAGYRVGMIVGGGALLVLYRQLGWGGIFAAMAGFTALATVPVLLAREPAPTVRERARPLGHFLRRPGARDVLVLILVYKAGEAFAAGMIRPYLSDLGLDYDDLGWLLGTVGFAAGLLGAVIGGALVGRLGRRPALLAFAVIQAGAVACYAALAFGHPGMPALYAAVTVEHLGSGLASAALFTCMMDWCSPEAAATDYTVQASAVVIASGLAATVSGFSAQALGYAGHFTLATALALVAALVVRARFPSATAAAALRGDPGAG